MARTTTPAWEKNMNPEQLEVIRHVEGPCAVIAQAGSGKTRALVHRIARMINEVEIPASEILAVTFSKKAAEEMNHRLEKLDVLDARIGTWHSLCLQILREDRTEWADWNIDEKDAAKTLMKEVLGYKHLNWKNADLTKVRRFMGICKANLWSAESPEAERHAEQIFGRLMKRLALDAYGLCDTLCAERGLLTFDNFLVFVHQHLTTEPGARERWSSKWSHMLQDEAQDANLAQCTIASLLSAEHRNYMVVGDVAQSIYGFRGSSPMFLARFADEWTPAKVITMHRNYRSVQKVVEVANNVIRPAETRAPTEMHAERNELGDVRVLATPNLDGEASEFASWVRKLQGEGVELTDICALFRTNAQSRALEEALLKARIPYVVVGGVSFYERKEVKDLLGYLRTAHGVAQEEDIKRCINAPFRYLGKAFVERVVAESKDRESPVDWTDVVRTVAEQEGLQQRQRASAQQWCDIIERVRSAMRTEANGDGESNVGVGEAAVMTGTRASRPSEVLGDIVHRTNYMTWLVQEEGEESIENSQCANVKELVRVAMEFPTVPAFLEYIDKTVKAAKKQRKDGQAGGERVLLMSIHRSKGLEWPYVFVSGVNENILPHARGDIEEERRLAYVAFTRARDGLMISYVTELATKEGIKPATPSRFIADTGLLVEDSEELASCQA